MSHCDDHFAATYLDEICLRVVLLSRVHIVVHSCEAGASSTAELGFEAEYCNSIFTSLELLAEFSFDGSLLDSSHLRVDQLHRLNSDKAQLDEKLAKRKDIESSTYHLLPTQKWVHNDFSNVKNKLSLCHF